MHLAEAVTFIPYGCLVDEFQHEVYLHPEMTPAERKATWRKLEKEYKPHLDYEGDDFLSNGGFWQRQQHIYAMPFYYIDYCLAQTCALEYKVLIVITSYSIHYTKLYESSSISTLYSSAQVCARQ